MNNKYTPLSEPAVWNWQEQNSWGGNCNSQIMQSPVAINHKPSSPIAQARFGFNFDFINGLQFDVEKYQEEVRIVFKSNPTGHLRLEFGTYEFMAMDYVPFQLVFRFPAEHTINDNRYDGEVIIQMKEKIEGDDQVNLTFNIRC
jgi:hypothetical protein